MIRNCLTHALDQWHAEGGYVAWRRSEHWPYPHMIHVSADGRISSYVAPQKLDYPLQSLMGFEGVVRHSDPVELARPMTAWGIFFGGWLLAGGVTVWALKRTFDRARKLMRRQP